VTHFLKNLDPEFENRRAIFCHQESLPTLEEAISAMSNKESRLRVMGSINPIKPAYVAVDDRECFNCGERGHLSYNCPIPKGSGGRGGIRGGRWSRGAGRGGGCGRGHGNLSANVASTEEAPSVTLTGEQLKMWEQWQKGKASETSLDSATTTSHFGNFANYAHLAQVLRHRHLHPLIDNR
jgi:hypothetical protein